KQNAFVIFDKWRCFGFPSTPPNAIWHLGASFCDASVKGLQKNVIFPKTLLNLLLAHDIIITVPKIILRRTFY
ncbi:MAG: hypothetical protein IJX62_06525, partial [Clostridia bacterium]|nr:hypothetical protein [Clostridia bacterium]